MEVFLLLQLDIDHTRTCNFRLLWIIAQCQGQCVISCLIDHLVLYPSMHMYKITMDHRGYSINYSSTCLISVLIPNTNSKCKNLQVTGMMKHYNMTVWILAGNCINFTIAAGLIRLHMPGVTILSMVITGTVYWKFQQSLVSQATLQPSIMFADLL